VSLPLNLTPQALCTQSSPVREPLLQAFLFPSTLGEVTLHLLPQACVFVYSSHGQWVFSPLLWSFPPSATLTSFPAPGCWVRPGSRPLWPGLACLFTVPGRIPLSPFGAQGAPPSLLRVFIVLSAYYSVSLFSLGGGQSVHGSMLIWPRVVCGLTTYHLAHLVHIFPSSLGTGV
jgi:hypothetical protein